MTPIPGLGADPAGLPDLELLFARMVSVIVGLGFVAMVIALTAAGIKYLTSGGESKKVSSAHQTITWAILGMLFMIVAWIVLLLIEAFTGVKLTVFNLKFFCNGSTWLVCNP